MMKRKGMSRVNFGLKFIAGKKIKIRLRRLEKGNSKEKEENIGVKNLILTIQNVSLEKRSFCEVCEPVKRQD
jgi:hypothetical protein